MVLTNATRPNDIVHAAMMIRDKSQPVEIGSARNSISKSKAGKIARKTTSPISALRDISLPRAPNPALIGSPARAQKGEVHIPFRAYPTFQQYQRVRRTGNCALW